MSFGAQHPLLPLPQHPPSGARDPRTEAFSNTSIPPRGPISINRRARHLRKRPVRPGREARTRPVPGRRVARRGDVGAVAPEHEPIRREQRGLEVDGDAADVEGEAEGVVVGEVGRDDEAGGLRVDQGEVGVADGRGGLVGDLGGRVGAAYAGAARGGGGEGDVLLEPDEGGWDRRAEVGGRVDDDGDVGCVEGEGAREEGGLGGDWGGLGEGFVGGEGGCGPL